MTVSNKVKGTTVKMKAITVVLSCLLVAACSASPRSSVKSALLAQERSLVVNAILDAVEGVRAEMIENGMEPMHQDRLEFDLGELGLDRILEGLMLIDDLLLHGITTFRIENMNYAVLSSTVTFDLYVDALDATMGMFELVNGVVDGDAVSGKAHGRVQVFDAHINGRVRVSVGIISGISLREVDTRLNLGGVKADAVPVEVHGIGDRDLNEYIETSTMHIVSTYQREISATINRIVTEVLEEIL